MTMKGYDRQKALAYMLPRLQKSEFKPLAAHAESLLRQAIDADMAYMLDAGILNENGLMGNAYYDDDEAFEFLLDRMARERGLDEDGQGPLAAFIDQYMDLQQQFLEDNGLMAWD